MKSQTEGDIGSFSGSITFRVNSRKSSLSTAGSVRHNANELEPAIFLRDERTSRVTLINSGCYQHTDICLIFNNETLYYSSRIW